MRRTKLPSPLDSPRFEDDDALSVFSLSQKKVVGSKKNLGSSKQYARQPYDGSPHIDPEHPLDPIGIEIVRGANVSSKDKWVVVVDGMRCKLMPSVEDPSAYSCKLPRGVELKPITSETRVRPIAVAVRLEADALTPLSAELYLTQILSSDERDDREESNEKSMGKPVKLRPYRVSDTTATSVTLPYPFWAPAQSALGILSMREIYRKNEKKNAISAFNAFAAATNATRRLAFDSRVAAYEQVESTRVRWETLTEATAALAKLTNSVKLDDVSKYTPEHLNSVRQRVLVRRPKAPKAKRPRHYPPDDDDDSTESSVVIGGKADSVAKELCGIFRLLVQVCEEVRKDGVKASSTGLDLPSLRQHLGTMRLSLLLEHNDKEVAAMFDCLLCTLPYPPAQFVLNLGSHASKSGVTYDERKNITSKLFSRQYLINAGREDGRGEGEDSEGEGEDGDVDSVTRFNPKPFEDLSVEQRNELNDENNKFLQRENGLSEQSQNEAQYKKDTPDYMFVYERLTIEQRRRTTVRSRINVHIVDFDGTDLKVNFEAEEEDGIVAHAVYSNIKRDIDEFDDLARELVQCLFEVYTLERGAWNYVNDVATRARDFVSSMTFKKYSKVRDRRQDTFGSLYEIAKYLGVTKRASKLGQISDDAPFRLDPYSVEERIAELRLMMRELLPVWPPTPPVNVDDLADMQYGEGGSDTEAVKVDEKDDNNGETNDAANPPSFVSKLQDRPANDIGVATPPEPRDESEEEKKNRHVLEAIRLQNDEDDRWSQPVEEGDELVVYYKGTGRLTSDVICRYLPQIVLPSTPLTITFSKYEFADAIIDFAPSEAQRWRWGWVAPVITGAAVAAGAALTGNFAFVGYMIVFDNISTYLKAGVQSAKAKKAYEEALKSSASAFTFDMLKDGRYSEFLKSLQAVAWANSGFTERSYLSRMRAMFSGATFGYNLSSIILSFYNRRVNLGKLQFNAYQKHKRKLIDKPANSCILAARDALKTLRLDVAERSGSLSLIETTSVVYNDLTGQRFSFFEYYEANTAPSGMFESLPPVYTNMDWNSVPHADSMRLTPPVDVAEKMYEVECSRGPLIGGRVEWLIGQMPLGSDSNPPSLAAKLAHSEMMQFVYRQRLFLRGEHLTQSAEDTGLNIAESATAMLSVAYGSAAGVTLVRGDDYAWSCSRGGVAARLALRHVSLFEASEAAQGPGDSNGIRQALKFWQRPRRHMMDEFVSAWKSEARSFARMASRGQVPKHPSTLDVSTEASRSFARVHVLETSKPYQRGAVIFRVLVSSLAHGLIAVSNHKGDELSSGIEKQLNDSRPAAESFEDQAQFVVPVPRALEADNMNAAWASRRIAPAIGRQHVVGSGAVSIIESLSLLSVEQSVQRSAPSSLYYCPVRTVSSNPATPSFSISDLHTLYIYTCIAHSCEQVGSRLRALPGHTAFGENAMNSRIVWLSVVERVSHELASSLRDALDFKPLLRNSIVIDARHNNKDQVGMERHPLVVSHNERTVSTSLSASVTYGDTQKRAYPEVPKDILESVANLKRSKIDFDEVRTATARMRSIAYNADRLLFALSLADAVSSNERKPGHTTHVCLGHPQNVLSLMIALVLHETEYGPMHTKLEVFVDRRTEMQDYLNSTTNAQASRATRQGCRACSLAEFSLCV